MSGLPATRRLASSLLAPSLLVLGIGGLSGAALPAQGAERGPSSTPRIVDGIESPLLYLAIGADRKVDGKKADAKAGAARRSASRQAVQKLLANPALHTLLGAGTARGSSAGQSLAIVRGVLGKCVGEIEIALTGVVPGYGQPLLVLRAELQEAQAKTLQQALQPSQTGGRQLAANHRVLRGQQTYAMLGADGELARGPGRQVELAIVGSDLVVTNDGTAMEELLAPPRTAASRRVLSSNERFLDLERRIAAPAGSLVIYGDWARLSQRLRGSTNGLPAQLLHASGLGAARSVMAALSCEPTRGGEDGEFTITMLLDFEADDGVLTPADRNQPTFSHSPSIDGWFEAALSVPARRLVRDLPGGGLGGLVMAVDLPGIASKTYHGAHLLRDLRASFEDFGLDFDRNVLSRLGARGTVQLLFRQTEAGATAAPTAVESIYSVRARSRTAAGDLFTDLRRAAEQHGIGRVVSGRDRGDKNKPEVLELRAHPDDVATCVAIQGDTVLVAFDVATIDDFLAETRRAARQRGKRNSAVAAVVERIGAKDVTGLFDLDLEPWFDHLVALLGDRNSEAGGSKLDMSHVPCRHVGYLDLQPRDGGTVVRICVLSSR